MEQRKDVRREMALFVVDFLYFALSSRGQQMKNSIDGAKFGRAFTILNLIKESYEQLDKINMQIQKCRTRK